MSQSKTRGTRVTLIVRVGGGLSPDRGGENNRNDKKGVKWPPGPLSPKKAKLKRPEGPRPKKAQCSRSNRTSKVRDKKGPANSNPGVRNKENQPTESAGTNLKRLAANRQDGNNGLKVRRASQVPKPPVGVQNTSSVRSKLRPD